MEDKSSRVLVPPGNFSVECACSSLIDGTDAKMEGVGVKKGLHCQINLINTSSIVGPTSILFEHGEPSNRPQVTKCDWRFLYGVLGRHFGVEALLSCIVPSSENRSSVGENKKKKQNLEIVDAP